MYESVDNLLKIVSDKRNFDFRKITMLANIYVILIISEVSANNANNLFDIHDSIHLISCDCKDQFYVA